MKHGLIVEDLPASATWLAEALQTAFPDIQARTVGTLNDAQVAVAEQLPDIALVDLGLPDGSGTDLIRSLAALAPRCTTIVSTVYADDRHLFPALRAGASGYLLKDQPREAVIRALQGIAAGEPPLSPKIAKRLLQMFASQPVTADNPLTDRETEVLTLVAKGYRLPDLASQLGVSRHTVASHIKAIYRKLNISSRAEATLEAARLGLVNAQL